MSVSKVGGELEDVSVERAADNFASMVGCVNVLRENSHTLR